MALNFDPTKDYITMDSPVYCEIDLDQDGKQHGFLRVPHSVHRSAYGWIPVPIVSIKNGHGPVVLLMAGNHGDEYEGQVALGSISRSLKSSEIHGQIILLPMANAPAAEAGLRTSPIDNGNLNRSFPGNPKGNPTEIIAHYIEHYLLVRADFLLDIHSGGSSLIYQPTLMTATNLDPAIQSANTALLEAMGFTRGIFYAESKSATYSSSAALRQNAFPITAEMAGAGTIDRSALTLLEYSLPRYLHHIGVLTQEQEVNPEIAQATKFFEIPDQNFYIYAYKTGLFEPIARVGENVSVNQIVGRIHFPANPLNLPEDVLSTVDGTIICKRVPARVQPGDCLYELGKPVVTSI